MKHFHVQRGIERKQLENRESIKTQEAEDTTDAEKIWTRTTKERMTEQTIKSKTVASIPSTKMTRKDLADKDLELLTLPPLDLRRKLK